MKIGVFVCVCDQDFHWVRQFVQNSPWPIAVYGDNLSRENWYKILALKPLVLEAVDGKGQFSETSKQQAFDVLVKHGYDWAIQMDIDETWEKGTDEVVEESLETNVFSQIGRCNMVHVISNGFENFIRQDDYFTTGREGSRERIYNLKYKWAWVDPLTNGAYLMDEKNNPQHATLPFSVPATTVHWGYMTQELRIQHKKKWDDVYAKSAGRNPYSAYENLVRADDNVPKIPMEDHYLP